VPRKVNLKFLANALAAGAAVFFCCGLPEREGPEYFAIRYRSTTTGRLERLEVGERRDASGPFAVTECRLRLRRWADGRGVVDDELTLVAARRPAQTAFYVAGRWDGGEFRYRRGDSWHFKLVDEFGNVTETRGRRAPSFVTFRGVPLPIATARRRPKAATLTSLELTSGRVSPYRGRGDGRSWTGLGREGRYVRFTFAADGAVVNYSDAAGVATCPANAPPRPSGFLYKNTELLYLPFIIPPASKATRLHLPLTARLSRPLRPEDLARPGQNFSGRVTGNIVAGTFTLEPASQPSLENAPADLAPAERGAWPHLHGEGELGRLAAFYRARGESVRVVTGLGLFRGNLLAPYDWLEIEGRGVGAPGRPVPRLRVALATSEEPATVIKFALAGEPKVEGRGARAIAAEIPGIKNRAELFYDIYCAGARAGGVAAWYEKSPKEPATVLVYGEILGKVVEGVAACIPPLGAPPNEPNGPAFAELIALGAAVAVAAEDDPPPYEFCFPADGGRPARARWRGLKAVVVDGERRDCRVYELEPGPLRAYYTYDGVLTGLECRGFVARLSSFPPRTPARAAPPAREQEVPERGGAETAPPPATRGEGESE
jgi:hypothetical protein